MQLTDFIAMLKVIEPDLKKNKGPGSETRTVWMKGSAQEKLMSDDQSEDTVRRIYIDRFTKQPDDSVPDQIEKALDEAFIPYEMVSDYEEDKQIYHFSFTCYVGETEESED